jgi:RimJ/RimL family protein N-acetyltransferase
MIEPVTLETERLILRPWREEDRAPFAALNADPQVMAYFPSTLDTDASNGIVDRVQVGFAEHGYGPWALEVKGGAPFIGFCGIWRPRFEAHFTPCIEIGWRLAFAAWGQGYATEASEAALEFGFERLGLAEIVAFATPDNRRSHRVMERLGMTYDPAGDFDHPNDPEGARRRHVLYRLRRTSWQARRGS